MNRLPDAAYKSRRLWNLLLCLVLFVPRAHAQTNPFVLRAGPPASNGWVRLNSTLQTNKVIVLQASTNLSEWQEIALVHDGLRQYPDAGAGAFRFYRAFQFEKTVTNDWKNQILAANEMFRSPTGVGNPIRWVKFVLPLDEPGRVYYQDSTRYPFHYDFASQRLPGFSGLSPEAFEEVTLHPTNQQAVVGAVLYATGTNQVEFGVQFAGLEPYAPQQILKWFNLVKATIYSSNALGVFYMPSFEQTAAARDSSEYFASNGVVVSSVERWTGVENCYSPGWALGRLKFFSAGEIDKAFADGRLLPEDVLLTDGVPAETPVVAGIISLTPSTPNSHVAILSKSFGIPFVYLPDAAERLRVQQMTNHEVCLRAELTPTGSKVTVLDLEGQLSPSLRSDILELKAVPQIGFTPKATFGGYSASTDALLPADIRYFGGKASNFGLLRRAVPTNSPNAIAFSFDLWDEFLEQVLPNGQTLKAEIEQRLEPYTNYPPDIASLKTNLAAIRKLLTGTTQFTAGQKQAITNALAGFTPHRKIRFRSSTNLEDSEHFTGAGLYDSFSGCLADDLDGDTTGPSQCDPDEPDERGVFRAMQKVYASFYNDNAFLERLRHRVDESEAGMAVLVHYSFPDEEELANGVATLEVRASSYSTNLTGELVTQLGAASVTNPDGNGLPEIVNVAQFGDFIGLSLSQYSSLVPLGAYVMPWQDDYLALSKLLDRVVYAFAGLHTNKNLFYLDFEYKKDSSGLVIKQVREIPVQAATEEVIPFVVNEPLTYVAAQEEYGDVFANHRLKSIWHLETDNRRMFTSNQVASLYASAQLEYYDGTNRITLAGLLPSWPGASGFVDMSNGVARDSWSPAGTNLLTMQLATRLIQSVTEAAIPILTQRNLEHTLSATYSTPRPRVTSAGQVFVAKVTNDTVRLVPQPVLGPDASFQQRRITTNGVRFETSFYWPKVPDGYVAGYTSPLVRFEETRITGLTSQPLVLRGYYSQTYRPGHHNFTEEFVFEPRLEPGIPPQQVEELRQAGIETIYLRTGFDHETGAVYLFDSNGNYRKL